MPTVFKVVLLSYVLCIFPQPARAADIVPYSIKSIKAIGSGFVELVGPGKIHIEGVIHPYKGTNYISTRNIDGMTSVTGVTKACVLSYSSEGYTENISVLEQSCNEIVAVIESANE